MPVSTLRDLPKFLKATGAGVTAPKEGPRGGGGEAGGANATSWENAHPALVLESLLSWQRGC